MLKILRTTLRQPSGLAKRKIVLRLPQEIPQKCVRRQVHGCRRADVKRLLDTDAPFWIYIYLFVTVLFPPKCMINE